MDAAQLEATRLATLLSDWSRSYYSGNPTVSDTVFDETLELLRELNPNHAFFSTVGAPTNGKIKHLRQMGSLNKLTDVAELLWWVGNRVVTVQPKADGCTVELQYVRRELVVAVTRGDGFVGEDVTAAILQMPSVPKVLSPIFPLTPVSIRGEVVLTHANWALVDPTMATNPRNVGTGMLMRDDTHQAHLLTFLMFDPGLFLGSEYEVLIDSEFQTLPTVKTTGGGVEAAVAEVQALRGDYGFDIDGAVIKLDNVGERHALGVVGNRPKGQMAFKWKSKTEVTIVTGVKLTIGHSGAVIPTLTLKPVRMGGVTVSNVLVNNLEELARHNVAIGDEIEIIRAGELIPLVIGVTSRPELYRCPCCGKTGSFEELRNH